MNRGVVNKNPSRFAIAQAKRELLLEAAFVYATLEEVGATTIEIADATFELRRAAREYARSIPRWNE